MHQWQFLCENRELLLHRMGHTPRAFVKTFGCQGNVADSEKIMGMLINMGCEQAEDEKQADIILYNTCAIRENAEILYTAQFPISDEGLEQLRTWLLEHAAAVNAANPESFRYAW